MKDYNDYNDYVKRDDVFDAAYCSVTIDELIEGIDRIPAADVVPVVRCKDCKHFLMDECLHRIHGNVVYRDREYYCADGERRE